MFSNGLLARAQRHIDIFMICIALGVAQGRSRLLKAAQGSFQTSWGNPPPQNKTISTTSRSTAKRPVLVDIIHHIQYTSTAVKTPILELRLPKCKLPPNFCGLPPVRKFTMLIYMLINGTQNSLMWSKLPPNFCQLPPMIENTVINVIDASQAASRSEGVLLCSSS